MTQPADPAIESALSVLDHVRRAAAALQRDDLAQRLTAKEATLRSPAFQVLVVGEFKQGKSSLLNALVGRPVCPVDDDVATAVPTIVRWAEEPTAEVVFRPEPNRDDGAEPIRQQIAIDDVVHYAVERDHAAPPVQSVEVGVPSRLLDGGLVLIDTPGVGGLGSTHGAVTAAAIPMAEAVIFVSDASQEFSAPELDFMMATRKMCPNIVCLVTKTDFYPSWRRIRDLNIGHLERLGIDAPIIATSAALHHRATSAGDANLLAESGYLDLTKFIRNEILGAGVELSVAAAASDTRDVLEQLVAHFATRKSVLEDPDNAGQKARELEQARSRADELKSRAAKWQVTLGDGVQDLTTDVDHDLRERLRRISQEGDDALGNVDPTEIWPEFEPWLYHRTALEVVANHELLQQRAGDLIERVAEHFAEASDAAAVDLRLVDPTLALADVGARASLEVESRGVGQTAMLGLRGGLGGVMMFGMLSSVVGLTLGPIGLGLGVVMGRKQLRDEKARQLTQHQSQARAAQRKYLDEVTFRTSKESRDALRSIQRQVRDHFTARAEEQSTSMQEMLLAVQAAAKLDDQERSTQLAEVDRELERLRSLLGQVDALGAVTTGLGSSDDRGRDD